MFVRTERLFLRPGWVEDLDDLLEVLDDDSDGGPRARSAADTASLAALPRTHDAWQAYLAMPRNPRLPHFFMYLRSARGARLVGGIGLGAHRGAPEVRYWIAADYRGRGFALEALRAVVEQARTLGHHQLIAKYPGGDAALCRVLEAAGFEDAGGESLTGGETTADRVYKVDLDAGRKTPHREAGAAMMA